MHGFGFAGALAEVIEGGAGIASIGAFNVGIEVAQIAVALAMVPVLYAVTRRARSGARCCAGDFGSCGGRCGWLDG